MRWILAMALMSLVVALPAQAAGDAGSKTMTIRLVSVTTQYKVLVDRAPKNEASKGDVIWAKSTLRNEVAQFGRPKGAIVGSDVSTLMIVSAVSGDVKVTAKLPGGTLRAAGRIRDGSAQIVPVVGGTGTFADARGTSSATPLNASGDRALNVYRLQLP